MLNIEIKTIADTEQRYNTVGDYQTDADGKTTILVSTMSDERHEFLIAVHELIESYLCRLRGITDEQIDVFDLAYEASRSSDDLLSEPGNQPHAPYHKEHMFATAIEKQIATELGLSWEDYLTACGKLMEK